jgi:hypothetical protein
MGALNADFDGGFSPPSFVASTDSAFSHQIDLVE